MARRLYERVSHLPIVSPHGHTDPRWCAEDQPFPDPARLFVARRVDCAYLAELVVTHRLDEDEAHDLAYDLAYGLAKRAYKL